MITTKTVICTYCGKPKDIPISEYNRQTRKGRVNWFCSESHSSLYYHSFTKNKEITKVCPFCGKSFRTITGKNERTYCSSSCAAKATVNRDACRRGGLTSGHKYSNTESIARVLKSREAFKYVLLVEYLDALHISYEFEKVIGNRVFDLVLLDYKVCIEFDGPEHIEKTQHNNDLQKEEVANKAGYEVARVRCDVAEVVPSERIKDIIERYIN